MKLTDLYERDSINDYNFIEQQNFITIVKEGFTSESKNEPSYIMSRIRKVSGYVGEIQMDYDSYDDYAVVANIHVVSDMRKKGIAKILYNKALELSKKKRKKGIASLEFMRNDISNAIWKKYGQGHDDELDLDIITKEIR